MARDEDPEGHPTEETLERFTAGGFDDPGETSLLLHLKACQPCWARFAALARGILEAPQGMPEAPNSREVYAFALARARARFERMLTEAALVTYPVRDPLWLRGFAELCLEKAAGLRHENLAASEDMAYAAVQAAVRIPAASLSPGAVADLMGKSWSEVANFRRVASNLVGAEQALILALDCLEEGTGAPLLLARHLDVAGSLLRDQRRFKEAAEAFDRAYRIYIEENERHLAGRVLVKLGSVHVVANRPEQAFSPLLSSLHLLDVRKEPSVSLNAVHNLLHALADAGYHERIAVALWRLRPLFERFASPLDQVRLLWMEARLWRAQGVLGRAERLYRKVIEKFSQEGITYDASLAALELAPILLEQNRLSDLLALLDGVVATFVERHIHREVMVTLAILRGAVVRGDVTVRAIESFGEHLRAAGDLPRQG